MLQAHLSNTHVREYGLTRTHRAAAVMLSSYSAVVLQFRRWFTIVWPGLKYVAIILLIMAYRSEAEIPVEVPSRTSTVTVNAVRIASSLFRGGTIRGIRNRSRYSPDMPTTT